MWRDRQPADLVRAAKAGDASAFDELLSTEYEIAFRVAYGLLQDAGEAEDAVQESALKAWRKLANLHEGASLRPWFLAIVANHCRTLVKTRWWSVVRVDDPPAKEEVSDVVALVDLRRAVARLPYDDRLVLVLRYYLDLPFDEIAATLGITQKASRRRIEKAVHRLRPALQLQEVTA